MSATATDPVIRSARRITSEIAPGRQESSNFRVADQVVLDIELPHLDVQAALRAKDESLIWRGYRAARDQEGWLDGLAASVGAHTRDRQHLRDPSRTTPWQHVLIAWPVLLPPHSGMLVPSAPDDRGASGGLLDKLHWWLDYRHQAKLFAGVAGYDQICRWSPLAQLECLQLLERDPPAWRAAMRADAARLPPGFPQLAFVVGSVSEWLVQPKLPRPGDAPAKDWELKVHTAARVGYVHGCRVAAEYVGVPQPFAAAVLEGLRAWLRGIARLDLVRGWQVHPGCDDTVLLELTPASEPHNTAILPLRLHHIGSSGLACLLADIENGLGMPRHSAAPRL